MYRASSWSINTSPGVATLHIDHHYERAENSSIKIELRKGKFKAFPFAQVT
jgi:hypothetical protein